VPRMIPDLETYFRRSTPERDAVLLALEDEARRESIPIVGPVVGELLYILVRAMGATRILELGTATGYSAIYYARVLDPGGQLVTFDKDWDMVRRARTNFEQAGVADRIEIRVGDAAEGLPLSLALISPSLTSTNRTMPASCRTVTGSSGPRGCS
jgi:caffeoyl-CoA O-methyltransferase